MVRMSFFVHLPIGLYPSIIMIYVCPYHEFASVCNPNQLWLVAISCDLLARVQCFMVSSVYIGLGSHRSMIHTRQQYHMAPYDRSHLPTVNSSTAKVTTPHDVSQLTPSGTLFARCTRIGNTHSINTTNFNSPIFDSLSL